MPQPPTARNGKVTRDLVLAAALAIIGRDGAGALSVRRLGATQLRPLEDLLALLSRAGFSGPDALRIYRAFFGFVNRHVLSELLDIQAQAAHLGSPRTTRPAPSPMAPASGDRRKACPGEDYADDRRQARRSVWPGDQPAPLLGGHPD